MPSGTLLRNARSGKRVIEAALSHAARHGHRAPCLMFGEEVDGIIIDELLGDPRVGCLLLRDSPTQIAERHAADPRVDSYFPHGNRSVPSPSEVVYFIGSGRRFTPSTVIHAARAGVQQLWVPVGFIWVRIPIEHLVRTCGRDALKTYGRDVIARVVSKARRLNILPR